MHNWRLAVVSAVVGLLLLPLAACGPDGTQDLEQLLGTATPGATVAPATDRYIVKFKPHANHVPAGLADINKHGGTVLLDLTARHLAVAATLPPQALVGLQHNPHIDYIEVDPPRYPRWYAPSQDTDFQDGLGAPYMPFGTEMVQGDHSIGSSSSANVVVCIIDSGYTPSHPDLTSGNVTSSSTGAGLPPFQDGDGHGTHVAGTIRALNNGVGARGVFPAAKLHIVRVFGDDGDWAYASELIKAVDLCWDDTPADARLVVNMSLGGDTPNSTEETELAAYYNNPSGRVLFVAAAGNGCTYNNGGQPSNKCDDPHYPASYPSVISVAAVDYTGARASFSQYAPQVELAAPGVDVLSTVPVENSVTAGGKTYHGEWIAGGASGTLTGITIADGGDCNSTLTATADWTGQVVVCDYVPGTSDIFGIPDTGAAAMVLADSAFSYTFGTSYAIPSFVVGPLQGAALQLLDGASASLKSQVTGSGYSHWGGTSMATPHVSGVAAKVWSVDTRWPNTLVRQALNAGALALGSAGTGNGLVRAPPTVQHLSGCIWNNFCNTLCYNGGTSDPDCSNYDPTYGTISGKITVGTGVTCNENNTQQDCKGLVVLAVTERDSIPYNAVRAILFADADLSTTGASIQYTVDVPVTGFPVYLWAFMFESGSSAPDFISGDLLSSLDQVTVPENGTLANQDVVLGQRVP